MAKRRLPRMVFDYIDGGADDEVTLRRSVSRFDDYELEHKVLTDVSNIDLSTSVLDQRRKLPFIISPTAASRLFHPRQGERAVASAAYSAGVTYSASTLASVALERLHAINPDPKWFQVYVWKDRDLVEAVLERVRAAGFSTLILTVDTPIAGNRERDPRNGFSIPPRINLKTATQALARPGYLWDVATSPQIGPENFATSGSPQNIADFINSQFDPSVSWEYAEWLKQVWGGPLILKGISRLDDAKRAIDLGADAIWISNHGGRQLDTARPTIDVLANLAPALGGKIPIVLDGGVRRGSHIYKAVALGADMVAIGRAYLFGLAAGGERGVSKAIQILRSELERTMALTGCASIDDIRSNRFLLLRR
ncbi:MAG: alpha-hydroxy acid oxidase [Pseudomonadota bacterium]